MFFIPHKSLTNPSQIPHIIPHIMLMQPEADTLTKDRQTGGLT